MNPHLATKLILLVLLAPLASARASGRFTLPLPTADLPAGVLTVKVVGDNLRDLKVGQEVELHRVTAAGTTPKAKVKTGADGRARFDGLSSSERYVVTVTVESNEHRSTPFPGPERGGVRLLLTLGAATMPGAKGGDRPAGHPPTGGLPPGHPPTSQPVADEGPGAAIIEADPELEKGQLQVVVVRGKDRRPLAGAAVTLEHLAKQAPAKRALPATDDEGRTIAALEDGSHRAQVTHDGLTYRSRSFTRSPSGGVRATFQVYDRTRDAGKLSLGGGSHWVSQIGEGDVRFMQVIQLVNEADAVIDLDQPVAFPLPDRAVRVEIPAELEGILVLDEPRRRVRLAAPVPPGGLPLRIYFEVPYRGATLEFRQVVPLRQDASAVVLMNGGRAQLGGPAIAGAGRPNKDGEGVVFPVSATEGGRAVEYTFTGLPHRDRRPLYVVLAVAGLVALWGLLAALGGPRVARQRRERREQLLVELAQLSSKAGAGGRSKRKQRSLGTRERQQQLRRELAHVWEEW